jgi:hypothetical protein
MGEEKNGKKSDVKISKLFLLNESSRFQRYYWTERFEQKKEKKTRRGKKFENEKFGLVEFIQSLKFDHTTQIYSFNVVNIEMARFKMQSSKLQSLKKCLKNYKTKITKVKIMGAKKV